MDIAALVISIVAVLAAIANVIWTQARTDRRETTKWERDSVKVAVSGLVKESNRRAVKSQRDSLTDEQLEAIEDDLRGYAFELRVIGAMDVYQAAREIIEWHHTDRVRARNHAPFPKESGRELTALHNGIVEVSQRYIYPAKRTRRNRLI